MSAKSEDSRELDQMFHDATYYAIRYAGLHGALKGNQWDSLAAEFATKARAFVDGLINDKLTEIEAAKEN